MIIVKLQPAEDQWLVVMDVAYYSGIAECATQSPGAEQWC